MACRDCDSPYHRSCSPNSKSYTGPERRAPGRSVLPDDVERDRRTRDGIREILRQTLTPVGICETVPSTDTKETHMKNTVKVEVDVDPADYALNYGTSLPAEIRLHTEATVLDAVLQSFERTGGWASLIGDSADAAQLHGLRLPA